MCYRRSSPRQLSCEPAPLCVCALSPPEANVARSARARNGRPLPLTEGCVRRRVSPSRALPRTATDTSPTWWWRRSCRTVSTPLLQTWPGAAAMPVGESRATRHPHAPCVVSATRLMLTRVCLFVLAVCCASHTSTSACVPPAPCSARLPSCLVAPCHRSQIYIIVIAHACGMQDYDMAGAMFKHLYIAPPPAHTCEQPSTLLRTHTQGLAKLA